MEITPTATIKTPPETSETETQTPTRIQPLVSKPLSFTNGVLKRHHQVTVTYKECLKNHAASLGGHAVDGCGEFMPSPTTNPSNPTSLTCAACGCHRNFHRRDPDDPHAPPPPPPPPHHVIEYQPHHRHHPPPPPQPIPQTSSPNNSPSPPPISSSYYPSAPHMLLALSTAAGGVLSHPPQDNTTFTTPNSRKRFRTKFTQDQKIKMHEFAEKVGWKMQKKDEETITDFCNEIGVEKNVLKVWMHNNKSTLGKRDGNSFGNPNGNGNGNGDVNTNGTLYHPHHLTPTNDVDDNNNINNSVNPSHQFHNSDSVVATNGSSSS